MSDMAATAYPSLRTRLREKLPEILIEAASIVVALLLALALNGWNERRQEHERAAIVRSSILAELRGNRSDIHTAQTQLQAIIAELSAALDESKPEPRELKVDLGLSLLSAAAWHSALATQSSQTLDFEWITRIAKVYELQDHYLRAQNTAADQLGAIPADRHLDARQIARSLIPRMTALARLADSLVQSYDDALEKPSSQTPSPK